MFVCCVRGGTRGGGTSARAHKRHTTSSPLPQKTNNTHHHTKQSTTINHNKIKSSADRKVNEFVKRVRALKIHVLIIGELKKRMPALFGKEKAQRKMLDRLPEVFSTVQREHHLPVGDFPDLQRFHHLLSAFDFDAFPKLSKASLHTIDEVMSVHIPNLVRAFDSPF